MPVERECHLCNSPRKSPGAFLTAFFFFLTTFWTNPCGKWEKKSWMGLPWIICPILSQEEGPTKCVNWRWVMSIKSGPKEKSFPLSSFFWLHLSSHPVCRLREPVPSAGCPTTAPMLTQIRFVHPPPCHYNIGSGVVSWFDTHTVLPWWNLMQLLFLHICAEHISMLFWSKLCKEPDVYISLHLIDNSWYLNDLPGASLSLPFEFCVGGLCFFLGLFS